MRRLVVLLICTSGLFGCGSGKGRVSGTVTFENKPVLTGTVTFFVEGSPPASGTITDGRYQVDVPRGEAVITVVSFPDAPDPARTIVKPDADEVKKPAKGPAPAAPKSALPEKYADAGTTDLKFTVEKGDNTCNLTLGK